MMGEMVGYLIKGHYKIIDERARGNFAIVYIARDMLNNHLYALKIMHPELLDDPKLLSRFKREASILKRLRDPHIVQIIDNGEDNYMYFIVMDYVDGHDLKYHIATEGRLEPLRALQFTEQIAEGLDAAHQENVIHRDMKPQNILINSKDEVKITDFGLSRRIDPSPKAGVSDTITGSQEFMGTAFYMAPEQAESGRKADIRSDLYSVAAVLFEMLVGHPPFPKGNIWEVIEKHMYEKVPSVCLLRPDLSGEIDIFMQKAMAKSPKDRYQTPREFLAAIQELQSSTSTTPRILPPKQGYFVILSTGESIPLTGETMEIGREAPNIQPDINLADDKVSRRHACLRNRQGAFSLEARHSKNPTYLNDVRLTPSEERLLKDGDILKFGNVEIRFELR